jgi:hypothetical protein
MDVDAVIDRADSSSLTHATGCRCTRAIETTSPACASYSTSSRFEGHGPRQEMASKLSEAPLLFVYSGSQFTTTWSCGASRSWTVLTRNRDPSADGT